jgi:hypothetical protein
MKKDAIRARQFMFVQDVNHLQVKSQELPKILDSSGALEWAYINHDKDQDETAKPIRKHYHVVLKYEHPQTIKSVAKLFHDKQQYVQVWHGRINNAYSYLIHETNDAEETDGKFHYPDTEVKASFDFGKRMKIIRAKIKLSPKYEKEQIRRYAEQLINRDQLEDELGVYGIAKNQQLIDKVDTELTNRAHIQWLKKFKGHKMTTLWLYGKAGVGKTRLAEYIFKDKDYVTLGSSRDHFQEYHGQRFVILNDLRPNDFEYSDLLRLLDPYQHDKAAPSRYHDKRLNLEKLIITTPYDQLNFYKNIDSIKDIQVDSINQLLRRIKSIEVTDQLIKTIRRKVIKRQNKKASHTFPNKN